MHWFGHLLNSLYLITNHQVPDTGYGNWASLFRASSASPDLHFWSRAWQGFRGCQGFEGKHWVAPLHFPPCSTRTLGIPRQKQWAPSLQSSLRLWTPQGDSTTGHSGNNLRIRRSYAHADFSVCLYEHVLYVCVYVVLYSMGSQKRDVIIGRTQQISELRLNLKELQTLLCPQSVICGGAWRVGWSGRPRDPAPAEVCRRLGQQTTEGALEGALSLSRTRAILTAGHYYVINGYAALISTHHGFYNELENNIN